MREEHPVMHEKDMAGTFGVSEGAAMVNRLKNLNLYRPR